MILYCCSCCWICISIDWIASLIKDCCTLYSVLIRLSSLFVGLWNRVIPLSMSCLRSSAYFIQLLWMDSSSAYTVAGSKIFVGWSDIPFRSSVFATDAEFWVVLISYGTSTAICVRVVLTKNVILFLWHIDTYWYITISSLCRYILTLHLFQRFNLLEKVFMDVIL